MTSCTVKENHGIGFVTDGYYREFTFNLKGTVCIRVAEAKDVDIEYLKTISCMAFSPVIEKILLEIIGEKERDKA